MNDRPSRRHSPAVYRRRRLTLAVLVLVVGGLLWWLTSLAVDAIFEDEEPGAGASQGEEATSQPSEDAASGSSGQDDGSDEPPDSSSADSPSGDQTGSGECAPEDIEVRASTGAESYARSDAPLLIMEVENTSSSDCAVDLGTGAQEFSVEHAGEEIFTTAQCGGDTTTLETDLEPGDVETSHLTWPLSDSSADCSEPAEVPSGEYELTVDLDGIRSEPARFMLGGD